MNIPEYGSVQLEIPNPHVLDSAEQFYAGAKALDELPPGSGVLLPLLTSAALAMELYLKALSSWSVIKDYQDYGDGVFGGIVSAEPQLKEHKLSTILESVLPEVRDNINALHSKGAISCDFAGLVDQVRTYDSFFINVRYSFENRCLKDFSLGALWSTLELLRSVVNGIDHKHYVYK